MIGGIGIPELLIILVIVLVIFGANKLPEIGSGMGRAIKDFKKASKEPDEIDISASKNQEDSPEAGTDNQSKEKANS